MKKMIDERIVTLKAEKEETLTQYQNTSADMQDILAERNMRINFELKFLNELSKANVSGSLPDFRDVIEARIKHFNSNFHTHEGSELQKALNTIRRLVPPIQFKIGGG